MEYLLQLSPDRAGGGRRDGSVLPVLPLHLLLPWLLLVLPRLRLLEQPLPLRHSLLRLHPARTLPRLVGGHDSQRAGFLWLSVLYRARLVKQVS